MEMYTTIPSSNRALLVFFYSEWCHSCKQIEVALDELNQIAPEMVNIIWIDIIKNPQIAAKYKVPGAPTLILIKNHTVLWRYSGGVSPLQLQQVIRQHCY